MSITIKEIQDLRTTGRRGVEDLAKLAEALNYGQGFGQMQLNNSCYVSSLTDMLEDNPGMIEAIYNFVIDNERHYDAIVEEEEEEEPA